MQKLFGGIEAGGTKFVCMVASDPQHIVAETRFATTLPDETLARTIDFFTPFYKDGSLQAIGIGSFGPLDLNPSSATYGYITTTPKLSWQQVALFPTIRDAFDIPVTIDTDVNGAALGENFWVPQNQAFDPFIYITVGTGIGVGIMANGKPLHGLVHPEGGHIFIPHDRNRDPFDGVCPYHGDCLEGLATGPAMAARWGKPAEQLPDDHPAWDLEADYVALALANMVLSLSPQHIALGGGVFTKPEHVRNVARKVKKHLNGYVHSEMIDEHIEEFVTPPQLGARAGVLGAIALALRSQ